LYETGKGKQKTRLKFQIVNNEKTWKITSTLISVSIYCFFQYLKKALKFVQDLLQIVLAYLSTWFSKAESTASIRTYTQAMELLEIKLHCQQESNAADITLSE